MSNEQFNLCEAKIALDESIHLKIINLQITMPLQQNFITLF